MLHSLHMIWRGKKERQKHCIKSEILIHLSLPQEQTRSNLNEHAPLAHSVQICSHEHLKVSGINSISAWLPLHHLQKHSKNADNCGVNGGVRVGKLVSGYRAARQNPTAQRK